MSEYMFRDFKRVPERLIKIHHVFESVPDFLDIERHMESMDKDCIHYESKVSMVRELIEGRCGSSGRSWLGIDGDGADVMKLGKKGWSEGVEKMQEFLRKLPPPPKAVSFRRRRRYGEAGQLDVNKWLSGGEDNLFVRHVRRKVRGRTAVGVTRVFGQLSVSGGVHGDAFFCRGLAMCLIASALEKEGRAVELWVSKIVSNPYFGSSSGRMVLEIPVKEAGVPVNLDTLAFMTALSGTNRILGFAYMPVFCPKGLNTSPGMGTPLDEAPPRAKAEDLVISGDINTEEKAMRLVNEYIGFLNEDIDPSEIITTRGLGY